jgi:hypothetical protein
LLFSIQTTKTADLQRQLAQSKSEANSLQLQLDSANEKTHSLESESAQLRAARALAAPRLEPETSAAPTPDDTAAKPKGNYLAQMFKDPQMRKLIASQQSAALRTLYSQFLKDANLAPDETDKFFQLLQDRQMALMDSSATAMSGGKIDPAAAAAATSTADDALKALLGPDRYGEYQDYEKTLGTRVQLQQLGQQLAGDGMPLQQNQNTALMQIMSEETSATPKFGNGAQLGSLTQDQIDQYTQQLTDANKRVYNRAMSVLTPAQLTAFQDYQNRMVTTQIAGIKMAKQMMNASQ